jgi:hypothetical protein
LRSVTPILKKAFDESLIWWRVHKRASRDGVLKISNG